jgi:hypothetical protein
MATYDYTRQQGATALADSQSGPFHFVKERINLNTAAVALTSANYFADEDIIQIWDIPAGVNVMKVGIKVVTVEGAALTCEVGDGASSAGWIVTGTDLNVAANDVQTAVNDAYGGDNYTLGKMYESADTIDFKIKSGAGATHSCVFDIWMVAFDTTWRTS